MIVYVFDRRWGGPFKPANGRNPKDVAIVMVERHESLPRVVRMIKAAIKEKGQGNRSIWLMHMCGHGNVGQLQLGTGLRADNAHFFKDLAEWMTVGGRGVVLHGCWTASGGVAQGSKVRSHRPNVRPYELGRFYSGRPRGVGRGWELLSKLSWALKAPVKAGIDPQIGDVRFRLEGPTITVSPKGYVLDDVTWRKRGQKRFYP